MTREGSGDHLDESAEQERERYRELLEELRVILPGVQVLFAFLLTAPFSGRFPELDAVGVRGYAIALIGAALDRPFSHADLIPPHRLGA